MNTLRQIPALAWAAALGLLAACTSPTQSVAENGAAGTASALEMAVLAHHDSLMVATDQLYALKAEVAAAHSPAAAPYVHGLLAADAAMSAWMHQYKAPDSAATPVARLAYFQQQQRVLTGITHRFRATMDSAAVFISQHPAASAAPASSK